MKTFLHAATISFVFAVTVFCADAPEAEAPKVNYTYNATVARVIDGGTVALNVDVGFGVWVHSQIFKLQGINVPDTSGDDKTLAMQWKTRTQDTLAVGTEVTIQSFKIKDKTGGYRAVIWKDGVNLNAEISKAVLK